MGSETRPWLALTARILRVGSFHMSDAVCTPDVEATQSAVAEARRAEQVGDQTVPRSALKMEDNVKKTPNTGKSLEYLTERARRMAHRYAETSPYRLNPKRIIWEGITRSLGRQAYALGWPYCP